MMKCKKQRPEDKNTQTKRGSAALYGNVKLVKWSVDFDRCFEGLYI